jgi:hypothetical protein
MALVIYMVVLECKTNTLDSEEKKMIEKQPQTTVSVASYIKMIRPLMRQTMEPWKKRKIYGKKHPQTSAPAASYYSSAIAETPTHKLEKKMTEGKQSDDRWTKKRKTPMRGDGHTSKGRKRVPTQIPFLAHLKTSSPGFSLLKLEQEIYR